MRFTIAPASPKTSQAVIRALIFDLNPAATIIGVYRDLSRVPPEFAAHPNFRAIQGDIADTESLDFNRSDAVFTITPPRYDGTDIMQWATVASENVKAAVKRASSVKRLVLLSSMGAEYPSGTGEIMTNRIAESILRDAAREVIFVRSAYFMENWATAVETVKCDHPFFFSTITPLDYKVPMVAVADIGYACAIQLISPYIQPGLMENPYIFELQGPEWYTVEDVQKAFEKESGKEVQVKPVEQVELPIFFGQFLPENMVEPFVEMTVGFLPGGIMTESLQGEPKREVQKGKTSLAEAIKGLYSA